MPFERGQDKVVAEARIMAVSDIEIVLAWMSQKIRTEIDDIQPTTSRGLEGATTFSPGIIMTQFSTL